MSNKRHSLLRNNDSVSDYHASIRDILQHRPAEVKSSIGLEVHDLGPASEPKKTFEDERSETSEVLTLAMTERKVIIEDGQSETSEVVMPATSSPKIIVEDEQPQISEKGTLGMSETQTVVEDKRNETAETVTTATTESQMLREVKEASESKQRHLNESPDREDPNDSPSETKKTVFLSCITCAQTIAVTYEGIGCPFSVLCFAPVAKYTCILTHCQRCVRKVNDEYDHTNTNEVEGLLARDVRRVHLSPSIFSHSPAYLAMEKIAGEMVWFHTNGELIYATISELWGNITDNCRVMGVDWKDGTDLTAELMPFMPGGFF